jgi:hypothetical protein
MVLKKCILIARMSFIEYETWRAKPDLVTDHDAMIRRWFAFLAKHRNELFPEWISARYYRQTDRDGAPTGVYIMLFEYASIEAHHAYKERRKDWSGPYAEYKQVDPYQFFEQDSVRVEFWEPGETDLWFDFAT